LSLHEAPALLRLTDQIRDAAPRRAVLDLRGGGSKAFYGEAPRGEPLDVRVLAGIVSYEPSELVVTVRAGTPLAELEAVLASRHQCLAFEPPRFAPGGTVGGMVAAGLSGPTRAAVGSLRDFVMGASLLNGRGELLHFGGRVMKNVAGYDVARVLAGSWGVLGVLCEVSLKVLPVVTASATLEFACDEAGALAEFAAWRSQPLPLQALSWHGGRLVLRLAGAAAAVASARARLGGVALAPDAADAYWQAVRDHAHPFFKPTAAELSAGQCLWRLSLPATAPRLELAGERFIEWGGALRWWRTTAPAESVRAAAAAVGGHATLVRAARKPDGAFTAPSPALMRIHVALKRAFDPDGIFNRGRLYAEL
jgi:FAD/FMN-containing dehydrogenase